MKITCVIPCYNYAQYLPEAIESVLAQTRPVDEIIVVDDGSTDNTPAVASTYGEVQIITRPNQMGAAAARNSGIAAARGDVILTLDADDKIKPTFVEKTAAVLEAQPDIDIVYTWQEQFGSVSGKHQNPPVDPGVLRIQNIMNGCALFRKRVWEKCREANRYGYHPWMRQGNDWEFWVHAICVHRFRAALVREYLYMWRRHSGSLSAVFNMPEVKRLLAELHPGLYSDIPDWVKKRR